MKQNLSIILFIIIRYLFEVNITNLQVYLTKFVHILVNNIELFREDKERLFRQRIASAFVLAPILFIEFS